MNNTMQHHHVKLTPQADKLSETRELLLECAQQVALHKHENGPSSWCATYDETAQVFYVEALFADEQAVKFHQANISDIVKRFGSVMAKPPETMILHVFAVA